MRSHEEILRLYQEHFGHSHQAGVFAVYAAGLEDGKQHHKSAEPPAVPPMLKAAPPVVKATAAAPVKSKPPVITSNTSTPPLPVAATTTTGTNTFVDRWVEAGHVRVDQRDGDDHHQ